MIHTNILIKPIITEKSMIQTAANKYTFEVDPRATKGQIRQAIQEVFGVNVVSVKTVKIAGKRRRVGKMRREIIKQKRKKAIIKLKSGQKIELFETQN
jgi:large subunit ribosomal protein L23